VDRTVKASRERLAEILREMAEGWAHLGNQDLALRALSALDRVTAGAAVVEVGHTEYRVEETESP
jgi:hypothetical protein